MISIPTISTQYYEHTLTAYEAEYVIRENLNTPAPWGAHIGAVQESLKAKGYISTNGLSDKSADYYRGYLALDRQQRITIWALITFKDFNVDLQERAFRYGEESIELLQACNISRENMHTLVDYVCDRPVGEISQEVGGVFTTLAVLCSVAEIEMDKCAEVELDRIWGRIDEIRERQKSKPHASPLQNKDISMSEVTMRVLAEQSPVGMEYGYTDPSYFSDHVPVEVLPASVEAPLLMHAVITKGGADFNIEKLSTASAKEAMSGTETKSTVRIQDIIDHALDIVEERNFIKKTELTAMLLARWEVALPIPDLINMLIKSGELKAFDFIHDQIPYRIKTVIYSRHININSLLGAE